MCEKRGRSRMFVIFIWFHLIVSWRLEVSGGGQTVEGEGHQKKKMKKMKKKKKKKKQPRGTELFPSTMAKYLLTRILQRQFHLLLLPPPLSGPECFVVIKSAHRRCQKHPHRNPTLRPPPSSTALHLFLLILLIIS